MNDLVLQPTSRDSLFWPRLVVGALIGAMITLLLFWVMQYLIATADPSLDEAERGSLVDFVRVKRAEIVERRQIKPKKPPPPKAQPLPSDEEQDGRDESFQTTNRSDPSTWLDGDVFFSRKKVPRPATQRVPAAAAPAAAG